MAKQSGLGQRLYVGGWDISGDVGAIDTCACPRGVLDVTALDKSAQEAILARSDGELSFSAFYNPAGAPAFTAEHGALSPLPTADVLMLWLMSTIAGDPAAALSARQIDYAGTRGNDGSLGFKVQGKADAAPIEWGQVLTAKITAVGATASQDNGASTASGIVCYLQLFTATGAGPAVVTVEHSADNITFTTLATFASVASPFTPQGQRITATGTVNRYLRANVSGVTDATYAVAVRRKMAQDDAN